MSTLKGGARKTEWVCSIFTVSGKKKPMYVNNRTWEKYPIIINKKGNLSYRNNKGLVKPVSNCDSDDIIKIFKLIHNPTTTKKETATVHSTVKSNKTKKNNNQIPIEELIEKIKKGEPLPNNNSVKHLMHFCKLATEKNAFANQTSPDRTMTPTPAMAKTPTPAMTKTPGAPARAKTPGAPARAKTPGAPARARMPTHAMAKTPTHASARENTKIPNSFFGSPPKRSPSPKAKTPTPVKAKTPTPVKSKTPTPVKAKTPTPVKAKTPTPVKASMTRKQRCDDGERCNKGTRCNKKTGYCEKKELKTRKTSVKHKTIRNPSSVLRDKRAKDSKLDVMRVKHSYKELGITETDYFEDVCLVLRNIRKKLHEPNKPAEKMLEWSKDKMFKLHDLSPFITNKQGKQLTGSKIENRDLYLGPHLIRATNVIGKGGYGQIYKGTFGHKNCAIKQSLQPMTSRTDVIDYYTEIIIQNELFCHAHRQALSQPKYAKIPKPYFMARLNETPLLGMEPLDDSLYNFIQKTRPRSVTEHTYKMKMTKVITDMFECLCNTLILLQDKYEFYHRDMHAGNIMYRKQGESYQWFLIDFGFATFKMNDYRFNWESAGPYGTFNTKAIKEGKGKGRVGHDLRLTLLFIFNLVDWGLSHILLREAFDILNFIYRGIRSSILDNNIGDAGNFWHRGYADAFNNLVTRETEPKVFLAETIPKLREVIANAKGQSSVRRTPTKTKKEYVHVERKEGKLQTKKNLI